MDQRPLSRYFILALSILTMAGGVLCAQPVEVKTSSRIDSMQSLVDDLSGTEKVDLLNKLAFEWFGFNKDKADEFATQALELSNELGYEKGKGEALIYKGLYAQMLGSFGQSRNYFNEGIALSRKVGNKAIEGYGLLHFGNLLLSNQQKDSASKLYQQSYNVLRDSLNPAMLSILYKNWSKVYGAQSNLEMERKYLFRSLKIREALQSKPSLVKIYIELATYFIKVNDYDETLKYFRLAEANIPSVEGEVESVNDLKYLKAVIFIKQSRYQEALQLFNEVREFYRLYGSIRNYVNLLSDFGYILSDLGNYELSLNYYYEGLTLAEENNFQYERSIILWRIGWVYYNIDQHKLSIEFANRCLTIAVPKDFKSEQATAYNLLGLNYAEKQVYDSALKFYQQALDLREELNEPTRFASTLNNIGYLLERQGRLSEALNYYQRGLLIEKANEHFTGIGWAYQSLGQINIKLKNFKEAIFNLDQAEITARRVNANPILVDVYRNKVDLYKAMNKSDMALIYFEKYDHLKDSISNSTLTTRIASLQSQYEITQKNQEIQLLNKDKALQQSQITQQRVIIIVGIAGLVLLVVSSGILYRHSKTVSKLNKDIQEQNEEIQAQSEELLEANEGLTELNVEMGKQKEEIRAQAEELVLSNESIVEINRNLERIVENRTAELRQAYQELDTFFYRSSHDFRRPLTTFMGLADVAKITVKDSNALELFQKVKETAVNLDKMLVKLQSISDVGAHQLIFKEVRIKQIFESECDLHDESIKRKGIQVFLEANLTEVFFSYPALIKIVVENIFENAIDFCGYEKPFIRLKAMANGTNLIIEIEDNGQGMDEQIRPRIFEMYFRGSERSVGNGLGLYIVKKAVDKLGGNISYESVSGKGTTFRVTIPQRVV